jgi:hypothetical protein
VNRRTFLTVSGLAALDVVVRGEQAVAPADSQEPIIDIHQHLNYSGRSDSVLLTHQRTMGISRTILLPAGRPLSVESTHFGASNGLDAQALGNDACYEFVRAHPREYLFGANEVPDIDSAVPEIERFLKRGAVVIAEQKFGVECDSAAMQKIFQLASGSTRCSRSTRMSPSSATRRHGGATSTRTTGIRV